MTDDDFDTAIRTYLTRQPVPIPAEHLSVCNMGAGAATCRYLVMAPGFACAKLTTLGATIDSRAATMTAQGDNCDGLTGDE